MKQLRFPSVVFLEDLLVIRNEQIVAENFRNEAKCRNWLASQLPAEEPRYKVTQLLVGKKKQTLTADGVAKVFYVDLDAPPRFDVEVLVNQPDPRPYETQLDDMGCEIDYDPRVDYQICQHNAVIMRELVFHNAKGVPYALRVRGREECKPPKHVDSFEIADKLACDPMDADSISHAIRRLGLDRERTRRLMHGFFKDREMKTITTSRRPTRRKTGKRQGHSVAVPPVREIGKYKGFFVKHALANGIAAIKGNIDGVKSVALQLETLADQLDEPEEFTFNDAQVVAAETVEKHLYKYCGSGPRFKVEPGEYTFKVDVLRQMAVTHRLACDIHAEHERKQRQAEAWEPVNNAISFDELTNKDGYWRAIEDKYHDDLDATDVENMIAEADPEMRNPKTMEDPVFTARALCDGTEALSHEFLTFLRFASLADLKAVRGKLRLRKKRQMGKPLTPEEWADLGDFKFMTDSQNSQCWSYIKARENDLVANVVVSASVQHTLDLIKSEGPTNRVKAYALSHLNGRSFNDRGRNIRFDKPTEAEAAMIFNTLYADRMAA